MCVVALKSGATRPHWRHVAERSESSYTWHLFCFPHHTPRGEKCPIYRLSTLTLLPVQLADVACCGVNRSPCSSLSLPTWLSFVPAATIPARSLHLPRVDMHTRWSSCRQVAIAALLTAGLLLLSYPLVDAKPPLFEPEDDWKEVLDEQEVPGVSRKPTRARCILC